MEYIKRLEEIEKKKAKERMLKGKADPTENSPGGGESRQKVADQIGISSNTIARERRKRRNGKGQEQTSCRILHQVRRVVTQLLIRLVFAERAEIPSSE